jgi:hypothetical protein
VSIWTTGSHGQFDNLAILFLLFALVAWPWAIVAVLAKQLVGPAILYLPVRRPLLLAATALVGFLVSLAPWALTGTGEAIWRNVITYGSAQGEWGLTAVGVPEFPAFLVLVATLVSTAYLTRHQPAPNRLVAWSITFLVFTSGYGVQYLVLPIALATLARSWWLAPYSLVAGLHLVRPDLFMRAPIWLVLAAWWCTVIASCFRTPGPLAGRGARSWLSRLIDKLGGDPRRPQPPLQRKDQGEPTDRPCAVLDARA